MKTKFKKYGVAACLTLALILCSVLGAGFAKGADGASAEEIETYDTLGPTIGGDLGSFGDVADLEGMEILTDDGIYVTYMSDYGGFVATGCVEGTTKIVIPDTVTVKLDGLLFGMDFPVTAVAEGAFYKGNSGDTVIKEVTIGKNVRSFGYHAFTNCFAITSINYNAVCADDSAESNHVFYGAGSGADTFTITIGADVERIPAYLFQGAGAETLEGDGLVFEKGSVLTEIGEGAFEYADLSSVDIPSTVTEIGAGAFSFCSVKEVYFDANLGDFTSTNHAFSVCGNNASSVDLTIGADVKRIPDYCFCDFGVTQSTKNTTSNPGSLIFEKGCAVSGIGENAFRGSTLTSYTVPDTVTEIGAGAFYNCEWAEEVYFNANVGDFAEDDLPFYQIGDRSVCTLTIGSSVKRIPDYCFQKAGTTRRDLYLVFESGTKCTELGTGAFSESGVSTATIGSSVTTIGEMAFYKSTDLAEVTIPESVTSIGSRAFSGCTVLRKIYFNARDCADFGGGYGQFENVGTSTTTNNTGNYNRVYFGKNVTRVPAYFFAPYTETGTPSKTSVSPSSTDKYYVEFEGSAVKEIGEYAFYYFGMHDVELPSGVEYIGARAFSGTGVSVTLSDTEEWYLSEEYDGVIYVRLEESDLSDSSKVGTYLSTTYTEYYWYRGDDFRYEESEDGRSVGIRKYVGFGGKVEIPSSHGSLPVTRIGEMAFYGCAALETLVMPSSVTSVGEDAFSGCTAFTKLYVESLESFLSIDFDGAGANPLAAVSANGGRFYVDESNTTKISAEDMSGVTRIGSYALADCTAISDVVIGGDVAYIGAGAFEGMGNLSSFAFAGTSGWTVSDGANALKLSATELEANALLFVTVTYVGFVWERTVPLHAAPTIECVVENFGYTNAAITVTTTVDGESSISYIAYTDPAGDTYTVYDHRLTISDGLINGLYVFSAVDTDGLESDPYYITYDDGAPEIYATGSDVWGGYVGNGFSVYAKDENDLSPVTLYYSRDGESWVSCGGDSFSVTPSGDSGNDGRYWFAACDAAGNKVGAYWIVLDTAVPYGEWGFTDDLSLYFSWDAPSYTTWTCTVNGKAYTKGATYRDETTYTAVLTSPTGNAGTVTYRLDHAYEEEYVEATCSQSAYRLYTCVYCGDVVMELDPLSTAGEHTYELYLKEPTCTESGYSEYVCTGCGAATGYSYIAPLGHIGVADSYIEPTCTSDGYTGTVCSRCGEKLSGEPITKLGHDFVPEYIDATCTEPAKTITTCSRCDDYYVEEISGEALGHEYVVTEYVAPDCENAGYRVFVCGTCGDSYTEDLPALGHSTVTTYVKDENGDTWAYEECTRCGEIVSAENLGSVEETASNGVIEIFRKYRQYMWWILLAFVAIWSIFIGLRWALARNSEEKAKSHSMLANYIIGIFVIAVILVGLPYLIYAIALLV